MHMGKNNIETEWYIENKVCKGTCALYFLWYNFSIKEREGEQYGDKLTKGTKG